MKNLHVVKRKNGWAVRRTGGEKAVACLPLRRDAIKRAKKLANGKGAIFVHGPAGNVVCRIPELVPSENVAATVLIKGGADMTNKGRSEIAAWLRKQAKNLVSHGAQYSPGFRARYFY